MTLAELVACCEAETVVQPKAAAEVVHAYTSDLLSDVMAHAPDQSVLVTIQNHRNTVAVATLVGCRAILICHHREIPADMAEAAADEHVAILRTRLSQFEATCRIGRVLCEGTDEHRATSIAKAAKGRDEERG